MRTETLRRARALSLFPAAAIGLFLLGSGPVAADALHRVDLSGTWRHEFSGWLFPLHVAGLKRVDVPYSLDGSDDVGARYDSSATDGIVLKIEVNAGATLEAVAEPANAASFPLEAVPAIVGVRAASPPDGHPAVVHYLFRKENWIVRIVGTTSALNHDALQALDAAVRTLPWSTLGSAERLH